MRRRVIVALGVVLAASRLAAQPPTDSVRAAAPQPRTAAAPASPASPAVREAPRAPDRWLGTDKLRHFVLAGLIQGVTFGSATAAGVRQAPALAAASVVTAAASVGKEVHDRRRGGRVSGRDLVWDAAGAALYGVLLARSGR